MTLSVIEFSEASTASSTSTLNVSVATTPIAGDIIIMMSGTDRTTTTRFVSGVSGLGATWSVLHSNTQSSNYTHDYWIGTGANASGNVTVTMNSARDFNAYILVIRGFSGTPTSAVVAASSSSGTSQAGSSQTAGLGEFVCSVGSSVPALTWPSAQNPAASWTTKTPVTPTGGGFAYAAGYAIPGSSGTHNTSLTSTTSGKMRISQVVLTGPAATTGTVAATLPALTVAADGLVTIPGQVAATLPALTAQVNGDVTIPGTVVATLPPLSSSITGTAGGVVAGDVAATLPALTAAVTGDVTTPVTGTVAATLPALTADVTNATQHLEGGFAFGSELTSHAITTASQTLEGGFAFGSDATSVTVAAQQLEGGFSFGSRLTQTRDWGISPRANRPEPRVVIAHRDGTPVTALDDVTISPLATGVGVLDTWRFSVDRDKPTSKKVDPVALEAHLYRGSVLMSKGPIGPGRLESGRMVYDCSDPRWYLNSGRRIGRVPKANWVYNGDFSQGSAGWTGSYEPDSIPAAPPVFYVVDETESTSGKGLRVEGVDKVVTTKTSVESADVFVPNSAAYLTGGAAEIIAAAAGIPDGETIHIVGHTADADAGTGLALSLARAQAAKATLAAHNPTWVFALLPGLRSPNMNDGVVAGRGEYEPVATNATEAGRKQNRRVDIYATTLQTASGHKQFVMQRRFNVINPVDSLVTLPVTVSGRMRIGDWLGPPADGNALWVGLFDSTGHLVGEAGTARMNEATPRQRWFEYNASIEVPADGLTYSIIYRLYPPAGWCVWADIGVYPSEQLGFFDVDQAFIVRDLTEHVQDVAFGHGDLGIGTRTPPTGITRTKEYPFHERKPYSTAVEEVTSLAHGVEVDCETTPSTATIVTHFPRQGSPAGLSLAHGGPRSIIKAYRPLPASGRTLASSVIAQAWGISATRVERYARDESALGGTLLEDVVEADGETPPNELQEVADQSLGRSIHPLAAWEVDLDPARTSEILDEIGKGDTMLLSLPDEGVHAQHRNVLMLWNPETDGLTLQLAPEEA